MSGVHLQSVKKCQTPTRQISLGMRTVPARVFSWVSGDTGKGFPSRSLRVSISSAWDSVNND